MRVFRGVDHAVLTVTDLDRSEEFYRGVFGFLPIMDFGYGRILIDRPSGFSLGIARPEGASGGPFSHLTTGLDHLGFGVETRDELVEWEDHLRSLDVEFTPIRDMEMAYHLNFRDPDNVALELSAPNEIYQQARALMASDLTDSQVWDAAEQMLGPEMVARRDR